MLIASIKDGNIAKRDGIGSDLKKHVGARSHFSTAHSSSDSSSNRSINSSMMSNMNTALSSPQRVPRGGSQTSSMQGSAGSQSSGRSVVQTVEHGDRPAILDEGLEFAVADYSAPAAVAKLESQYPHIQPRMLRYYRSLVDKHEHLAPALKPVVTRSPFEPAQSGSVTFRRCIVCGGRALTACTFDRCRICCQLQPQNCAIHQKLTSTFGSAPRPLDRSGAPITHGSSAVPCSTSFNRKSAPAAPKATHILLGEMEAPQPWQELREEALYRSVQNSNAMDSIFSSHSVEKISSWLDKWMQKAPTNHTASLTAECEKMEAEHAKKMDEWRRMAQLFDEGFNSIGNHPTEETRREVFSNLDDVLPVPLTPRKRLYMDT